MSWRQCDSQFKFEVTFVIVMKYQLCLLLSGVISVVSVATSAVAQPSTFLNPSELSELSVKSPSGIPVMVKGRPGNSMSAIEELELSDAQRGELAAIQSDVIEQMSEILTLEQMQALATSQRSGDRGEMRRFMMSLDREDRSSVMSIMRTAQSEMMDVLTPEQRTQIEGSRPIDRN